MQLSIYLHWLFLRLVSGELCKNFLLVPFSKLIRSMVDVIVTEIISTNQDMSVLKVWLNPSHKSKPDDSGTHGRKAEHLPRSVTTDESNDDSSGLIRTIPHHSLYYHDVENERRKHNYSGFYFSIFGIFKLSLCHDRERT